MNGTKSASRYITILTFLALMCPVVCTADRIVLHNGGVLEGNIIEELDGQVKLLSKFGEISLKEEDIKEIIRGNAYQVFLDRGDRFTNQMKFAEAKENYLRASRAGCQVETLQKHLNFLQLAEKREKDTRVDRALEKVAVLKQKGLLEKAIELLSNLPAEERDDPRVKENLGELLCKSAYFNIDHFRYSSAVEDLVKARDIGAPEAELHFLMGLMKRGEGRSALAMFEFEAALQKDPNVYQKFPGVTNVPLFPVPVEARVEVAMTKPEALDSLEVPKLDIGLDKQAKLYDLSVRNLAKRELEAKPPDLNDPDLLKHIDYYAKIYSVDPLLVEAVARVESGLDPCAVSPVGALGVMQLMPLTAKDMGVDDPLDPPQNIRGGAKYLSLMIGEFKDTKLALAAYNAGPGTVRFYKGIPPYPETRKFVPCVMKEYERLKKQRTVVKIN